MHTSMKPDLHDHRHFYGTATIGEKGQVVVPADVRKTMGLKSGDKLLVFGMGKNMVTLAKFEQLEKMADMMSKRVEGIRQMIKNA